jgi:hypothetical protein
MSSRRRAALCGRAATRYANGSKPAATRFPASVLSTALCATSSFVTSELNACSLSANNLDDNDDGDEVFRALPAATCLRRKTESSQGIPDPGLVITVVTRRCGRSRCRRSVARSVCERHTYNGALRTPSRNAIN